MRWVLNILIDSKAYKLCIYKKCVNLLTPFLKVIYTRWDRAKDPLGSSSSVYLETDRIKSRTILGEEELGE